MKLLNVVKMIIGLGAAPSPSAGGDDAATSTDGKDVRNDKHAVGLGPPLLLSVAVLTAGGGLLISDAAGAVKVGFNLDRGFVLEISRLEADIVKELEDMRYPESKAGQVRQVRRDRKGPWAYPSLELIARADQRVRPGEAGVCSNSELLGEQIVLANKADRGETFLAVKVSATREVMSCPTASSGDPIVLVNADDMKELAGHEGEPQIEVIGSALGKDITLKLPESDIENAGSVNY